MSTKKAYALLLLDSTGRTQRTLPLMGNEIHIGRGGACTVVISDSSVSRRHCRLFRRSEAEPWQVQDLASTNGTLVNGKALAHEAKTLACDDEILCGARATTRLKVAMASEVPPGTHAAEEYKGGSSAGGGGERQLLWALRLLATMYSEEHARRRDLQHQVSQLRTQVRLLQELRPQLPEVEMRSSLNGSPGAALQAELAEARQLLRARDALLDEARATTQYLRQQLDCYQRAAIRP